MNEAIELHPLLAIVALIIFVVTSVLLIAIIGATWTQGGQGIGYRPRRKGRWTPPKAAPPAPPKEDRWK